MKLATLLALHCDAASGMRRDKLMWTTRVNAASETKHCVRTVSDTPRTPGQTAQCTGTLRCTSLLRKVVDRECIGTCRYAAPARHGTRWGGPVEEIRLGDVVWFPPGEKHWHGAAPTTAMTHIAIQKKLDGKPVDWPEHVTAEQYEGRSSVGYSARGQAT